VKNHKRAKEEFEEKLPAQGDYHLDDLINMRMKEILDAKGLDVKLEEVIERRQIRAILKTQSIFEIPTPVNDPKSVEEIVKVLIGHIESKRNSKIHALQTLANQPKIVPNYEELDRNLQEWCLGGTSDRQEEGSSESSEKKARISMIKGIEQQERTHYEEEVKEQGFRIGSQGEVCRKVKDQKIREIDEKHGEISKDHVKLRRRNVYPSKEKEKLLEGNFTLMGKDSGL
jgi:hypothetical protein